MKNLKKIIILLAILLIIIIVALVILFNMKGNTDDKEENNENTVNAQTSDELGLSVVSDYKTYYTIKEILNNYLVYVKQINGDSYVDIVKAGISLEEARSQSEQQGTEAIKNILDKQYISDMAIDDNMIIEKQKQYSKNGNFQQTIAYDLNMENILTYDLSGNTKLALITATLNDQPFNLLIKIDYINNTYSIFLEDFLEKYSYNANMNYDAININSDNIEVNDYNTFLDVSATEEYITKQYFSEYREKMTQYTEEAYNLLDQEYRDAKFGNYENFLQYVNNNKLNIETASIQGYKVSAMDGIKEYICYDQYGKYYIFTETSVTNYDVVLDTYTIDLPDFLEEYNSSNNAEKAGLNSQKIVDALNDGDYTYVYNKLDATFRQNNFATVDDFETYVKNTFYTSNNVEFSNYRNSGDLYVFDAAFTDKNNANSQAITKTFIVQLGEGTDFTMSFNVQ